MITSAESAHGRTSAAPRAEQAKRLLSLAFGTVVFRLVDYLFCMSDNEQDKGDTETIISIQ